MEKISPKLLSEDIPKLIDYASLDPYSSDEFIIKELEKANYYSFRALCTYPTNLPLLKKHLSKSNETNLISVIAFPFGAIPSNQKKAQAEWAVENGAKELDVVPNFKALMNGKLDEFSEELAMICSIGIPVRVILNMAHVTKQNLYMAIEASLDAGVSGLQSGNGFGPSITSDQIKLLSNFARGRCSIKAVGGIHRLDQLNELLEAGAHILGTSNGPAIIEALKKLQK